MKSYTPKEIVEKLDKYIVSQKEAKRCVAIALRNRWRRQQLPDDLKDEVAPKNIIMIGPTGVGKTEIARRLSRLASSPFLKVEASKFTEVGYIGRDVESIVRDLTHLSVNMLKEEQRDKVAKKADVNTEDRILDLLLPGKKEIAQDDDCDEVDEELEDESPEEEAAEECDCDEIVEEEEAAAEEFDVEMLATRDKFRKKLRDGDAEDWLVNIDVSERNYPMVEIFSSAGFEEMDVNLQGLLPGNIFSKPSKKRKMKISEARKLIFHEETQKLIDMDDVVKEAISRVEESGIIFLDEIDKIAGRETGANPDISREGVQRDLLPIIEGSTVTTKYGMVKSDHILFIAAGAFHVSKPSDLIPELQGRFPIRVELQSLNKEEFVRILTEPKNALIHQYIELMKTENVKLEFEAEAIEEIASTAALLNHRLEDIGARRLHTIMEYLLDSISFDAPDMAGEVVNINMAYVQDKLKDIIEDEDLSKYIL